VVRKFGLVKRRSRAYRISVQHTLFSIRKSQFKCRVAAQAFATMEESVSFAAYALLVFATCLYRTAVRNFCIRFLLPPNIPKWEARACVQDVRRA
jgi:hypothetical protein